MPEYILKQKMKKAEKVYKSIFSKTIYLCGFIAPKITFYTDIITFSEIPRFCNEYQL